MESDRKREREREVAGGERARDTVYEEKSGEQPQKNELLKRSEKLERMAARLSDGGPLIRP